MRLTVLLRRGLNLESAMQNKTQSMRLALATAIGVAGLFASPTNWSSPKNASLIAQAEARIGRPLTPGSVAGVNRRVHRRAARGAYYGGTAGAIGAGTYYGSQYYNSNSGQYYNRRYGQYGSAYGYGGSATTDGTAWCASRYRSYNPATGTYLGYDGSYHSCP